MNVDSVDREPWVIGTDHRPPALEIVLVKQTVVLSWLQFVYAEGSDDEVRIAFASHDVILRGTGLSSLLHAITANRVTSIREPARTDLFPDYAGRFIREVIVRRAESTEGE